MSRDAKDMHDTAFATVSFLGALIFFPWADDESTTYTAHRLLGIVPLYPVLASGALQQLRPQIQSQQIAPRASSD